MEPNVREAAPSVGDGAPPAAEHGADKTGFRGTYDREFSYVWRSLLRFGVPERLVEDAVQDVFVVFHRRLSEFDPERPIRPWLGGIAFRVASDYRNRAAERRESYPDTMEAVPAPGSGAERVDSAMDARNLVRRALEAMDLDRRAVLVLHDMEGHSMPEIVLALRAPLNTLYSRLRLGREEFAAAVRRLQRGGG